MANPTHRYVGGYARDIRLANDKTPMLAPGDFVTLSKDDLENEVIKEMLDSGSLIATATKAEGGEK